MSTYFLISAVGFALAITPQKHKNLPIPTNQEEAPRIKVQEKNGNSSKISANDSANILSLCPNLSLGLLGLFSWMEESKDYLLKKNWGVLYRKEVEEEPGNMAIDAVKEKNILVMGDGFAEYLLSFQKRHMKFLAWDDVYSNGSVAFKDFKDKLQGKFILDSLLSEKAVASNSQDFIFSVSGLNKYVLVDQKKELVKNANRVLRSAGEARLVFEASDDRKALELARILGSVLEKQTHWGVWSLKMTLKPFDYVKRDSESLCQWSDKKTYLFFFTKP